MCLPLSVAQHLHWDCHIHAGIGPLLSSDSHQLPATWWRMLQPCSRHPRGGEVALDASCLEAVPVAQWKVCLGKDQRRSHPLATCSLHQGEGSPGSILVLARQASLLRLPKTEAQMGFKPLQRQLRRRGGEGKKKGCEDQ